MSRKLIDSHRHRGLRMHLVKTLRDKNICSREILEAFANVKRHYFLDDAFADWAYKDTAFPIDADQTISQPSTVALQTELLNVAKGMKVLEVGTGSGFQACILSYLGVKVYTIERQRKLFEKTSELLIEMGYPQIRTLYGDGYAGSPRFAPFDRIIITCGATSIPGALIHQLAPGGIMIIPLGDGDVKKMVKITKGMDGKLSKTVHGTCRFVPFLSGTNGHASRKSTTPKNYINLD